jgi:hypothetical protein
MPIAWVRREGCQTERHLRTSEGTGRGAPAKGMRGATCNIGLLLRIVPRNDWAQTRASLGGLAFYLIYTDENMILVGR